MSPERQTHRREHRLMPLAWGIRHGRETRRVIVNAGVNEQAPVLSVLPTGQELVDAPCLDVHARDLRAEMRREDAELDRAAPRVGLEDLGDVRRGGHASWAETGERRGAAGYSIRT